VIAEDLLQPSWNCVHFLDPEQARRVERGLADVEQRGLRVVSVQATALLTHDALLTALGEAFAFPGYYGHNYNALDECLRDLSWLPASGHVLRVEQAAALWREAPEVGGALVRTWLFCAEYRAGQQAVAPGAQRPDPSPFHLLFLL
jgi:hypothetical protein